MRVVFGITEWKSNDRPSLWIPDTRMLWSKRQKVSWTRRFTIGKSIDWAPGYDLRCEVLGLQFSRISKCLKNLSYFKKFLFTFCFCFHTWCSTAFRCWSDRIVLRILSCSASHCWVSLPLQSCDGIRKSVDFGEWWHRLSWGTRVCFPWTTQVVSWQLPLLNILLP